MFRMNPFKTVEAGANDLAEELASDVHSVLSGKDVESLPQLKALRQRVETKMAVAREIAAEKARIAASRAKEIAGATNDYAHDQPWKIAAGALAAVVLLGWLLGRRDLD